ALLAGEPLEPARSHQRALHAGGGDLEHVPLGHVLACLQERLQRAAHTRAVVQGDSAVPRRDVDAEAEHRPGTGAGPLQLDQLEAHGLEPGVELPLERIPVHGSPSIKKWGYVPHFSATTRW